MASRHRTLTAIAVRALFFVDVASALSYEEADRFVRSYMPDRDHTDLSDHFLSSNTEAALATRGDFPWGSAIPDDIFLDYVLPYSSMDEDRDGCRHFFRPFTEPLVRDCETTSEAALEINRRLWDFWGIHFKGNQTPEILSPTQVIAAGFASCTGVSIFLVCALRSVGVPARVTGTPAWLRGKPGVAGGNHDWVEVWTDGVWSFTGPVEYTEKGWNRTWFYPEPASHQLPGSRRHGIFATSWRETGTNFPLTWAPDVDYVHAVEVTGSYVKAQSTDERQALPRLRGWGGQLESLWLNLSSLVRT